MKTKLALFLSTLLLAIPGIMWADSGAITTDLKSSNTSTLWSWTDGTIVNSIEVVGSDGSKQQFFPSAPNLCVTPGSTAATLGTIDFTPKADVKYQVLVEGSKPIGGQECPATSTPPSIIQSFSNTQFVAKSQCFTDQKGLTKVQSVTKANNLYESIGSNDPNMNFDPSMLNCS